MLNDVRYALRSLAKNPGVVLLVVVCLGLGVGANTTIFSLTNAVFVRKLPVHEPDQLVRIYAREDTRGYRSSSYPELVALGERTDAFAAVAAFTRREISVGAGAEATIEQAMLVSDNFFRLLGVRPALGRFFTPEEARADDASALVVISYPFWQSRFGGDSAVVGRMLPLSGRPYLILGVAPRGYHGLEPQGDTELWVPLSMHRHLLGPDDGRLQPAHRWLALVGRLNEGMDRARAQAVANSVANGLRSTYGTTYRGLDFVLLDGSTLANTEGSDEMNLVFLLLNGIVGVVLLIACANVANVLLARVMNRRREIAIRLSLGSGPWRLVRQLMIENILLSLLAGLAGFLAAMWSTDLLSTLRLPIGIDPRPDLRVLAYAFAVALASGLIFGLVPALQATRTSVGDVIKHGSRSGTPTRSRLRSTLVVAQVSLSVLTLVVAGLLLRTLYQLRTADTGAIKQGMLAAELDLTTIGADTVQGRLVFDQVMERVGGLAGVESATLSAMVPSSGIEWRTGATLPEHEEYRTRVVTLNYNIIGPQYLGTLGIPLIAGRELGRSDRAGSTPAALVNDAFVKQYWPNGDALGKHIRTSVNRNWEIVGVVRDVRYESAGVPARPTLFMSYQQEYSSFLRLQVRVRGKPTDLIGPIRRELQTVHAGLAARYRTFEEIRRDSEVAPRLVATLLTVFGSLALLIAAVGLYGVTAYLVAQRTHEVGVRMALGARPAGVLGLFARQGLRLAGIGVLIGFALSLGIGRLISSVLYGVSPFDPLTIGAVSLLMFGLATLASVVPARRAARIDPVIALRSD